ncbi:MAG TPA: AMP-binding protein [Candidatus Binatia bacterium]|nr:AMP-binding protein [Candidatus Binatia bacterium]
MNIGESLIRNAQHFPDKRAIVDASRTVTYAELHERTNRLANYLLNQGVAKGDLVALSIGSRAEHFEALFAIAKIGAIAVPFDFNWSAQECESMLDFFAPKAFFLEIRKETEALQALADKRIAAGNLIVIGESNHANGTGIESAIEQTDPAEPEVKVAGYDPFLLMITSGTTGFPKACSIDHQTYSLRCLNYSISKGMNHNERALMTLPVHFNAGRGSVMAILYLGGTIIIQEKFDAERFLRTIEQEEITYTMLVPILCERLLGSEHLEQYQTSSLRFLGITGGHLSRGLARQARRSLSPGIFEAYASTDCGQITTVDADDWETHGDSVGKPIWCVLVRIADDDSREAPRGEQGEICVRTPLAIQGYYRNPGATAEFLAGGWCHTGDMGFLDREGYLHITGRKKNMVKSGGISVFPEEIEEILRRHPDVADIAVVGFKSPEWGEAVKAFVVLVGGAKCSADGLIQFCKNNLAPYKAPKVIEFCTDLPRTGLGKIDRAKLAAL